MDAAEAAIELLNGEAATTGSVANTVATEIAKIVNENNNGSIDTLNEIAAWIINDSTGAAKMANDIATLNGADTVAGSVANSIKVLKESLDAEVTSEDGEKVTVKVTEVDGIITAVNVTEADIASAATLANLSAVVGQAKLVEGEDAGQAGKTVVARIAALEGLTGTESVEDQILAVTGTPDEDMTLQGEIDAVEGRLDVIEGEAAGSIKKAVADEATRIDAIVGTPDEGKTIQGEIDDLEALVGDVAVGTQITTAIAALDSSATGKDAAEYVQVTVNMEDGKLTETNGVVVTCSLTPCTAADVIALFTEVQPDAAQA